MLPPSSRTPKVPVRLAMAHVSHWSQSSGSVTSPSLFPSTFLKISNWASGSPAEVNGLMTTPARLGEPQVRTIEPSLAELSQPLLQVTPLSAMVTLASVAA